MSIQDCSVGLDGQCVGYSLNCNDGASFFHIDYSQYEPFASTVDAFLSDACLDHQRVYPQAIGSAATGAIAAALLPRLIGPAIALIRWATSYATTWRNDAARRKRRSHFPTIKVELIGAHMGPIRQTATVSIASGEVLMTLLPELREVLASKHPMQNFEISISGQSSDENVVMMTDSGYPVSEAVVGKALAAIKKHKSANPLRLFVKLGFFNRISLRVERRAQKGMPQ